MKRHIETALKEWKTSPLRLSLLVRGARQVGKTYTIEQFGKANFDQVVKINFEESPEAKTCFTSLKPADIIPRIELLFDTFITPGKTLLFLDEIQACPQAYKSLRYFKEQLPELHVVGAGSLLELVIDELGYDVGRVQSLYMFPLSFQEFLDACGQEKIRRFLTTVTLENSGNFETVIHEKLLGLVRDYWITGGMPAAVNAYLYQRKYTDAIIIQQELLKGYRLDFAKYGEKTRHSLLEELYVKIPRLVGQKFKYVDISPDIKSRDIKTALIQLEKAGIVYRCQASGASGIPLEAQIKDTHFKLVYLDIGLLQQATGVTKEILLDDNLTVINKGAISEQFVGQELLASQPPSREPRLFYWTREQRSSKAEVDYVTSLGNRILPIEVKAGKTGRLKSLQLFLEEKKQPLGIRISQNPLSLDGRILSIPFYMIAEIPRLMKDPALSAP